MKVTEILVESRMGELHSEFADVYHRLAPKIQRHKDVRGAEQLYQALKAVAVKNNAVEIFKDMLLAARRAAHMDYDTNPGGFENWFWYLPFDDDDLAENINFYDRFGHDSNPQARPYTVEVQDRETGGKKLISIEAVSRDDARERARDRGYTVVRVVSQDESGRKRVREHDGRDDEPEEIDDDGRTMADRARRDGRGSDDLDEPETAAKKRKRSLQATRDFNRGRRADSMREGMAEGQADANRFAAGWLGRNRPDLIGVELEVVPEMT